MLEFEISGSLNREAVDKLRQDLDGIRVGLQSGLGGERLLKILGDLSEKQIDRIRAFLLRMLGSDQIGRIVIKSDSIEIANVSASNLDEIQTLIGDLAQHVRPAKRK